MMLDTIRHRLFLVELIELGIIGLLLGGAMIASTSGNDSDIGTLIFPAFFLWFCYGTYLLYILLARLGGQVIDILLWVILAIATASFTFWCWTILDINRLIISRLFYKGDTPIEYAWSSRSKRIRKEWG